MESLNRFSCLKPDTTDKDKKMNETFKTQPIRRNRFKNQKYFKTL